MSLHDRHSTRRSLLLPVAAIALLVALVGTTCAQATASPQVEREARRLFTLVMSPYCPGLTLADCTSSAAAALRDSIRAGLGRGATSEQIMDELAATFGDEILALPPNRGVARLAWLAPIAVLAVSLAFLLWRLQRRRQVAPVPAVPTPASMTPAIDDARRRQLEDELRRDD